MAAAMRVVEDLPLVPSTWIASKPRSGDSSAVIMRRIRSRPKRIPNSSSERSARSASASVNVRSGGSLCVGVPAQVVDEQRAQGFAQFALAAVQRVFDQPFRELDVEVGLALVAGGSLG